MRQYKLYNAIFPLYMLYAFLPIFWFISLIGNFIIDSILLIVILFIIYRSFNWKLYKKVILNVWIIGFIGDLLGAFYLTLVSIISNAEYYAGNDNISRQILSGIYLATNHSPLSDIWSIVFILSGVLVSAICIFVFNYFYSFRKTNFTKTQRILSSLSIAIFTAPYTFLLPSELIMT